MPSLAHMKALRRQFQLLRMAGLDSAGRIAALDKKCGSNVKFIYLDIDNPANENYVRKYGVNGIPRMIFMDTKGTIIYDWLGSRPASYLEPILDYCN